MSDVIENLSERMNTHTANFPRHPGSLVDGPGSFHTRSHVVCRMWARHDLTHAALQRFRWTTFFLLSERLDRLSRTESDAVRQLERSNVAAKGGDDVPCRLAGDRAQRRAGAGQY